MAIKTLLDSYNYSISTKDNKHIVLIEGSENILCFFEYREEIEALIIGLERTTPFYSTAIFASIVGDAKVLGIWCETMDEFPKYLRAGDNSKGIHGSRQNVEGKYKWIYQKLLKIKGSIDPLGNIRELTEHEKEEIACEIGRYEEWGLMK